MFKIIAIALSFVIAVVLIYAATRPDNFRIERSISIQAPPEKVHALINDFHQWEVWSPWEKVDPQVQRTYSGHAQGVGAKYAWSGNKELGQGSLEIISATPEKLVMKIDFLKPFEAHNMVEFVLKNEGKTTQVTQAMYGSSPYISKVMCLFFDMDKMVGDKQAEGLASIKMIAEKS